MAALAYRVTFRGEVGPALRRSFTHCSVHTGGGRTVLECPSDLLREVLGRLQSMGLDLVEVRLVASR